MSTTTPSSSSGPAGPADPFGPDDLERVLVHPSRYEHPAAPSKAAVAAIFAHGHGDAAELLFIQRATVDGDPWSGQMAFPGGRHDPTDTDSFDTARRETREEIGLDLSEARQLGSLTDVDGGRAVSRPITVSGHCFWLIEEPSPLELSHEVAEVLWVPVSHLLDRDRYIDYTYTRTGLVFPGIQLDNQHQVIWGLTLRLLSDMFARLGRPFIGL